MPEISRFLGLVIRMYYQDHNPPHFHVTYNNYEASIEIEDFSIMTGDLPPRIYGIIVEWASLHKKELLANWKKSQKLQQLRKIKPLV